MTVCGSIVCAKSSRVVVAVVLSDRVLTNVKYSISICLMPRQRNLAPLCDKLQRTLNVS